jgi:hypothetical protein
MHELFFPKTEEKKLEKISKSQRFYTIYPESLLCGIDPGNGLFYQRIGCAFCSLGAGRATMGELGKQYCK